MIPGGTLITVTLLYEDDVVTGRISTIGEYGLVIVTAGFHTFYHWSSIASVTWQT